MSGNIVTHGDGRARFDKGVTGEAGRFAAVRTDEPAAGIPTRAPAPSSDSFLATASKQLAELTIAVEQARTRQDLKQLAAEVRRRYPEAAKFAIAPTDSGDFEVIGALDKHGDWVESSGSMGMLSTAITPSDFPALERGVDEYAHLFPKETVTVTQHRHGRVLLSIDSIADASIQTGNLPERYEASFTLTNRMHEVMSKVRKAEVAAIFDELDELKGSFPDNFREIQFYFGEGPYPKSTRIVDQAGEEVWRFYDSATKRASHLSSVMTMADLHSVGDRLQYNETDKYLFLELH